MNLVPSCATASPSSNARCTMPWSLRRTVAQYRTSRRAYRSPVPDFAWERSRAYSSSVPDFAWERSRAYHSSVPDFA
eukprot:2140782-Rhodomonas_salina.6